MNADEHGSAIDRVLEIVDRGEQAALVTIVRGGTGRFVALGDGEGDIEAAASEALRSGKPHVVESAGIEYYVEPYAPASAVVICGAGHIGVPLARMAAFAGYRVTVIDDRPDYANAKRFPTADEILAMDFEEALAQTPITSNTAVVLVTRGHKYDWDCLRAVAGSRAHYIGMIGSQRRVKAAMLGLERDGVPADVRERINAPIGLDIGAETPEEIAVAILAEIVLSRRGGTGRPLTQSRPR